MQRKNRICQVQQEQCVKRQIQLNVQGVTITLNLLAEDEGTRRIEMVKKMILGN